MSIATRVCVMCSAQFEPDVHHQRALTCSVACNSKRQDRVKAQRRQVLRDIRVMLDTPPKWKTIQRNCEYCQQALQFRDYLESHRKRFCNHSCATKFIHKNRCPTESIFCKGCQKSFIPKSHIQKFCTKLCGSKFSHRNVRQDGNGNLARERDLHECRLCGSNQLLVIHHIDGSGEGESPNHQLDNLVTLCRGCHNSVHRLDYRIVNGVIVVQSALPRLVGTLPMRFAEETVHEVSP